MGRIVETLKRADAILRSVKDGPKPISQIAEELDLRWNTVQLYVNELKELGLLKTEKTRSAPPQTLVMLTEKGRALVECLEKVRKPSD